MHLDPRQPNLYNKIPGERTDGGVNKNLFFNSTLDILYITTGRKVCLGNNPQLVYHIESTEIMHWLKPV